MNAEVTRNQSESTGSIIRRFTKKTQSAGIVMRARSLRYRSRPLSRIVKKKSALKRIVRRKEYEVLAKLGKLPETKQRHR